MVDGGFSGYVDDGAVALFEHGRDGGAGEGVAGVEVEGEHAVEGMGVEVPELDAADVAADGIYEGVEATVGGEDLADELIDCCGVGDVEVVAFEGSAVGGGCALECGEFLGVAVGDGYGCTLGEEGEGDSAAESAGATGYENDVLREVEVHGDDDSALWELTD